MLKQPEYQSVIGEDSESTETFPLNARENTAKRQLERRAKYDVSQTLVLTNKCLRNLQALSQGVKLLRNSDLFMMKPVFQHTAVSDAASRYLFRPS
ncbi:hypothetical protein RRG08_055706 [Elysia crispata]|uniref:Uncharacterized protein n=1 Tax=Elysia crispata TaxID=231223 RepID=A0AAE1B1N3_9GAST|nr:hypothetical protein RRG08_055706 [Elysia crispata]